MANALYDQIVQTCKKADLGAEVIAIFGCVIRSDMSEYTVAWKRPNGFSEDGYERITHRVYVNDDRCILEAGNYYINDWTDRDAVIDAKKRAGHIVD
jgi:hypothetical protein